MTHETGAEEANAIPPAPERAAGGILMPADSEAFPHLKSSALVEKAVNIWARTTTQSGAQIIFAGLGISPTAWG
jgi:hypothetical protein